MIIVVVKLIADVVRSVAELLLTLGASISTTFRQVRSKVASIVHTHRLPISTVLYTALAILGIEVAYLTARITQV